MRSLPLAFLACAAPLCAQTPTVLFSDQGVADVDKFGYSVRTAGDLNGDTIPDYIYSSPFWDQNGLVNGGIVRIRSGADASLLYEFVGDARQDEFGYSVNPAGDTNGDGFDDVLITELVGTNRFQGRAFLVSGLDGSNLHTFEGDAGYDYFGIAGAGIGDVNGDGYPDVAVSAPGADPNGNASGLVRVYSGISGSELYSIDGLASGDQFGWFLDGLGDVNDDGYDDFIASAPFANGPNGADSGTVTVHSGLDGSVLHTVHGDGPDDRFGWCVSTAGDVDRDMIQDFIVGGYQNDNANGTLVGMARVFSGADGSVLYSMIGDASDDAFGWCVRDVGDLDGDGHGDFGVGAPFADGNGLVDNGLLRIYSGATGVVFHELRGVSDNAQMGYSFGTAGDLDRDGYPELISGAAFTAVAGQEAGVVEVLSFGGTGTPPQLWDRSRGCPGSNGHQPSIELIGRVALNESFKLRLRGAQPNTNGILHLGRPEAIDLAIFAPGCLLLATPDFGFPVSTDLDGRQDMVIGPLPNLPGLIGGQLHKQFLTVDPGNNFLSLSSTKALVATIGL